MDEDKEWADIDAGWETKSDVATQDDRPRRTRAKKKKKKQQTTQQQTPAARTPKKRRERATSDPQPKSATTRRERPWLLPLIVFVVLLGALVLALVASDSK